MTESLYSILEKARAKRDNRPHAWLDNIVVKLVGNTIVMTVPPNIAPTDVAKAYKAARSKFYSCRRSKPISPKWAAFFIYAIEAGVDPDNLAASCNLSQLVSNFNNETRWSINSQERRRVTQIWKVIIRSLDKFLVPQTEE